MRYESAQMENEGIMEAARRICIAARTAPKARGLDEIETLVLTGAEKDRVTDEMKRIGEEKNIGFFVRDAANVASCSAVVLVATRNKQRGIPNCGYCGFADCGENKAKGGVCALCSHDLGIALGSAAGIAADLRIDTRIMFSFGKAALALGLLPDAAQAFGIPLSVSGKSPFFDRAPVHPAAQR